MTSTSGPSQGRLISGGYRKPEQLCILSFGAGQDSSALLMKLMFDDAFRQRWAPGRLLACFADTGDEHEATYRHLESMQTLCGDHGVELHALQSGGEYYTEAWSDLISHYRRNNTVGSKAFRKSCSGNLKISPWYRWLEDFLAQQYGTVHGNKKGLYEYVSLSGEKIRVLIGLAAGEEKRISNDDGAPAWMIRTITREYPLATELGWDRADCQDYIRSMGYEPPRPSLCKHCPYKTELEVLLLSKEDPEAFEEWAEIEARKLAAFTRKYPERGPERNHGVFGANTELREIVARAEKKYGHLSYEQLHQIRMKGHHVGSTY